ncbi:MAG: acyl-CoA dehydrogenase family protein [Acidimicrobiales bacterium]
MDLTYPPEADEFRAKVRAFLEANLPAGWKGIGSLSHDEASAFTEQWRKVLHENGYLALSWPKEVGGAGLTPLESVIVAEEFAKAGAPTGGPNDGFGITMLGNTMLRWGTDEQKRHFLPRVLSGEDRWCQGYSEPAAGSDLGNLGCRAVLDGDEWVINGQKIWTSAGHLADHIFVLARTDATAAKHRGITFLLVDMRQPGVEVRPIKMMSGDSEFNEVFFSDARCPKENVLGEVNGGWAVAMTLLGNERGAGAAVQALAFRREMDKLVELAKERGATDDPTIRQRMMRCHTNVEIMRFLSYKALTAFLHGHQPGADASIGKLFWSHHHQQVTELAVDILGADAMVPTGQTPHSAFAADAAGSPNDSANWTGVFYNARAGTIYAGTSQVQKGIVGEQILGLPKEPRADGGPWNEIPGHG